MKRDWSGPVGGGRRSQAAYRSTRSGTVAAICVIKLDPDQYAGRGFDAFGSTSNLL